MQQFKQAANIAAFCPNSTTCRLTFIFHKDWLYSWRFPSEVWVGIQKKVWLTVKYLDLD